MSGGGLSHDDTRIWARPDGIQVGFTRSVGTYGNGIINTMDCGDEIPWDAIIASPAAGGSYVLDPPDIDTSMWDGCGLTFYSYASNWPAVSVFCDLSSEVSNSMSVVSSCTYRGEDLVAEWSNGTPFNPGMVVTRRYADVVEPFPTVGVFVESEVMWWISNSTYSVMATNLIDTASPFIPAPELPPEPAYPTPLTWNIGPC
jgi:hypothetical protein